MIALKPAGLPRPYFLTRHNLRLLLFGGKGGVGKTSCAAAAALSLAESSPQSDFLLVSTDPAHSLSDCLGRSLPPPNLQVVELDAPECLASFKRQHAEKLAAIALRGTFLDQDDIRGMVDLSLPGLDELMAALEIGRWVETNPRRRILVDTAPTGHTLRLMAMPALLRKWLEALQALLAKHRYLKKLYRGSLPSDEIDQFLLGLSASAQGLDALLRNSSQCQFVPVMAAEEMSFQETRSLLEELENKQTPVPEVVMNRLYPENSCPVCLEERARQGRVLDKILNHPLFARRRLWGVPLYPKEVRGREALQGFWSEAVRVARVRLARPPAGTSSFAAAHAGPLDVASMTQTLLLFAGKGGVGKTTLACATSLRLAQERPATETLLFSADPAHSLSACLNLPIGPVLTPVCPGLTALELNPEAEFRALKELYADELKSFLESFLPGMDLAFDREAMERILDLAPPGLDEVMALTRIMEFLKPPSRQTLALDSAPTGHLIRLLEMPELVDRWLKVFFGLFLKYRRVFRMPQVAQRLVEMSKQLKRLRSLLADRDQCALCAVSILTEMAFEETKDLLAACGRIGLHVACLFLNQATPPNACPLCAALRRRESLIREKFRTAFPDVRQVLIYRQGDPRGLERLRSLATAARESADAPCATYA